MSGTADMIYLYDASFEGFLTCVYDCVYNREMPVDIICADDAQPSMFLQKNIETDNEKAARVYESIPRKICGEAAELVRAVFLSCAAQKEMLILRFLLLGYRRGAQAMYLLSNPDVAPMYSAERHLKNEVHLLLGFVRFSDYGEVLAAVIHPKNFVLPYMQTHFVKRFMCENFIIYDEVHKAALVYYNAHSEIISLDALTLPPLLEDEKEYRAMWAAFYKTIAITARENPRCRMTHCPKRYWQDMLEVRPELDKTPKLDDGNNVISAKTGYELSLLAMENTAKL
ncbi:MAG: DNA metabolism protein [Clostridia bacterium]|nr:DNA metabolism protein [Clostridia bacterium]NLS84228.1 DNA metabolism protein [Oscillospiraceae bacterium]